MLQFVAEMGTPLSFSSGEFFILFISVLPIFVIFFSFLSFVAKFLRFSNSRTSVDFVAKVFGLLQIFDTPGIICFCQLKVK